MFYVPNQQNSLYRYSEPGEHKKKHFQSKRSTRDEAKTLPASSMTMRKISLIYMKTKVMMRKIPV
jgi:hypothetical protein